MCDTLRSGMHVRMLVHVRVSVHVRAGVCVSVCVRVCLFARVCASDVLQGRRYPSVSKRLRVEATGTADCADVTHPRAAASPATAEGASPATHVAGR